DTTQWQDSDLVFDYDRPLPKYYEYEYILGNLLPTIRYYVSVTAFDFGFAEGNIPSKESNKLNNITEAFAQTSSDTVEEKQLDAYIYPNPYRLDAAYAARGFENREGNLAPERARRIHFANLPKVCTISIYSLDGDRIDSWEHNFPDGGPESMHDEWDVITRNGLEPVSGLYYWVVESKDRTQIGKLVIIK
ncbi:MAG: hypothetical protein D6800_14015, partial [Candidatus Zixiibacteriota bacterium]